jgi:tRNA U34 2-thiouridine synthase MnmA/TrmU
MVSGRQEHVIVPFLVNLFCSEFAGQVCEQAGVQLHTVPLTEQYWQRVVSHCLAEIKAGRTPNPDVLCNSR